MIQMRLAVFGVLASASGLWAQKPAEEATPPAEFSVHEWGTFTTVQGSDGVTLLGAHHEEEHLPGFVHCYPSVHNSPLGQKGLPVPMRGITQKMETPILYFHTTTPLRVKVGVEFKEGLISQWYPEVATRVPERITGGLGLFDLTQVKQSIVTWDVELVPDWASVSAKAPPVRPDEPWGFAREVDAAGVRVLGAPGTGEVERYLFYRGLGRFALPRCVKAGKGGVAEFVNAAPEAVPSALVMEVGPEGARFRMLGKIAGKDSMACELGAVPLRPLATVLDEVQATVAKGMLVPEGLHADEARAMVRTWARSWFAKPGMRALYVVPRAEVERILPLSITPKPKAIVRVLLGRIEFFTPEVEEDLSSALHAAAGTGFTERVALDRVEARLDRFFEPALRRVLAVTADGEVRAAARKLLAGSYE